MMEKKNFIRLLGLMSLGLLFFVKSHAQERLVKDFNPVIKKHAIGLSAGYTIGYGLTYRYWPKKFGFQATGLSTGRNLLLGGSIFYKLVDDGKTAFFLYQGNQYHVYRRVSYREDEIGRRIRVTDFPYEFYHGIGFGLEFRLWKNLNIAGMVGYGVIENQGPYLNLTSEISILYQL